MAEKKKLTVAEILAAARANSKAPPPAAEASEPESVAAAQEPAAVVEPEAVPPAEEVVAEAPAPVAKPPVAKPAAAKPAAAPAAGGKPSVADILAAARANKAAAAPSSAPAAAKPAAAKPAAAVKSPAAEKPVAAAVKAGPVRDTSSILAAARGGAKAGPVSKAEAAARDKPAAKPDGKAKLAVPPMPVRPEYVKAAVVKAAGGAPQKAPAVATEDRRWFVAMLVGVVSGSVGSFMALGFTSLAATGGLWTLGLARFMFPNVLTEPPNQFKVGPAADFPAGTVSEKFKAQFGVWIVNAEYQGQPQIVALKTVCTHLGCTPNWLEGEQKFKCPCHGSGFYKDGINFEGPAPRPLERYAIRRADDGQLEVDKSKTFQEEMGNWADPASFVAV